MSIFTDDLDRKLCANLRVIRKNDILTTLDMMIATVKKFPVLDNVNNYMSDARLTTFFSPKSWLLLFEIVGYSAPENEFVDHIYLLGNCVANTVQMKEEIFVEETEENSVWDREEEKWLADWRKWEIMVRGKVYEFQPSLTEYKEAGVEIIKTEGRPGSLRARRRSVAPLPRAPFRR